MTSKTLFASAALAALALTASAAQAGSVTTIWSNSAGTATLREYDLSGNLLDTITPSEGGNGRGIVQVGNVLYWTNADSGNVYAYNYVTNTDLGVAFTVSGASGLATMAYDGHDFYLGDYSGTNNVYKYTPGGTLLATISLKDCSSFCDGLEYANGNLVSNEYDGGFGGANTYDVYKTDGTLLTHPFITGHNSSGNTGIAFDGTDYYVSNVFAGTISVYDSSGTWLHDITLSSGGGAMEDLSVNYTQVLAIPEPATWSLMFAGFGVLGAAMRSRRKQVLATA
ncbi:MAG: PEPxxWA-CTERM sorting domain-containing protein [Caulobacteraceae bacterium]